MTQGSRQLQAQAQQQLQTLSPQQILVVKLLELPTVEMEERVRAEILDNPALEEGREVTESIETGEELADNNDLYENTQEDLSLGDYLTEDDIPDYKLQERNRSWESAPEEIPFSDSISFYEILMGQLDMQKLSDEQRDIAEYLIGSLDDDGFLRKGMTTLIDELAIYRGIYTDEQELEEVLHIIQHFDPAGIGARDLRECLLLQLKRKPQSTSKDIQLKIISKYCDDFTRKNKDKIMERLNLSESEYEEAANELTKLNPRPGSSLGEIMGKNMHQIVPDFIVETEEDGSIHLTLNDGNIPQLRLSREFSDMLYEQMNNKENQRASRKRR